MPLSVVILAAGQGKRMNSSLPKVLQPLAGKPLLKHVIDTARALKPESIYVVYGHGGGQVQDALHEDDIDWVAQDKQLGTGHAVLQAMPMIPDSHSVLILYGDVPLVSRATLEKLSISGSAALTLLSVDVEDPHGYGRIIREGGKVRAIVEQNDATELERSVREINTGLMAAPAAALKRWLPDVGRGNSQGEYYLTDIIAIAVGQGSAVEAIKATSPKEVMGVNDRVQLAEAEAHYRDLKTRELMLAGATLADPKRTDVRGAVTVGRDVFIDVNVVLSGKVHLADGVKVGAGCLINDTSVGEHTEVFPYSVLDNAEVGARCRVGPYARLRPQAKLGQDVHIGNFVEVKNADIGDRSKANHLTYLGDAVVGKDVNVGAGSIACNYDGFNKWPTYIDDNVFIGSGTMMVAPVRIRAGSTIGAGSTITESTPEGKLTLERSTQVTINKWQRPKRLSEDERQTLIDEATLPKK